MKQFSVSHPSSSAGARRDDKTVWQITTGTKGVSDEYAPQERTA